MLPSLLPSGYIVFVFVGSAQVVCGFFCPQIQEEDFDAGVAISIFWWERIGPLCFSSNKSRALQVVLSQSVKLAVSVLCVALAHNTRPCGPPYSLPRLAFDHVDRQFLAKNSTILKGVKRQDRLRCREKEVNSGVI